MAKIRFPWQSRSTSQIEVSEEFVALTYALVLKREPDEEGLQSYLPRLKGAELTPAGLTQGAAR